MAFLRNLQDRFFYYLGASYHRRLLDRLQEEHCSLYRGVVLDIGGRDRGRFRKPKYQVARWIFADINPGHHPDMVLDVTHMDEITSGSIDVINAIELFEHVEDIEQGLRECYRCLKEDGAMVISCPFLFAVHSDPYDFQRWTAFKWEKVLKNVGFRIETFQVTGRFFTVWGDMARALVRSWPGILRKVGYIFFPLIDCIVLLDRAHCIANAPVLCDYHGGYFLVVRKG